MEGDKLPLLDSFFDETPLLTPEKCIREDAKKLYLKYLAPNKVETAVLFWAQHPDNLNNIFADCEFISDNSVFECYLWKKKVLFARLRVGAPTAAAFIEEVRIFGIKNFIAAGTAGCIDKDFDEKKVLVIDRAIRDEGTSYHYLPASAYVDLDKTLADKLAKFLAEKGIDSIQGTSWTTDAFYRETNGRIAKRLRQGALAVEMECAALAATTRFYGLNFGQFVWFSDKVLSDDWTWLNTREDRRTVKEKMLFLALEFASGL